ncbi:MAG TPA: alpha/beta fold hydrolase [Deltaproteobacteria bacterium]|nr:alpha/beta fold hydrolase [Deltaproteobacteria bacterium]
MGVSESFAPPAWLRGRYVQTILASSRLRVLGNNPMELASEEMILDAGENIRLQGFLSRQKSVSANGLVILLHGWEGSAHSTYIQHSGREFHAQGYAVFRLNFRDHGDTHHLNEGLFYGTLLEEVFTAVKYAAALAERAPAFLVGFSLGGNFALRIARRCLENPIENMQHIFAISPVLDPSHATDAIDRAWLLKEYFLRKWKRSLRIKQALYPHLYDFTRILPMRTLRSMTDALIEDFGIFPGTQEYFETYTIRDDALMGLRIPTSIIASRDDPAIPVQDFLGIRTGGTTTLYLHDHGGHNGFLNALCAPTWYEAWITQTMQGLV